MTREELARACAGRKFSKAARKALALVLVDGAGYADAARRSGLGHRQSVYRAVKKINGGLIPLSEENTRAEINNKEEKSGGAGQ